MMIKNNVLFVLYLALLLSCTSCGVYSLKSGSIPVDVKTISIANVVNQAGGGPANVTQLFAEKIKTYFQQNSRLEIVKNNGDWQLEPTIIGYDVSPVAPIGGGTTTTSAYSRLTIRLQVKFTSLVDEKANYDQTFSFFGDYLKDQSLSALEGQLIDEISEKIVFDIFTKTTSNW